MALGVIGSEVLEELMSAARELLDMNEESEDARCHVDLIPMDKCARCSRAIRLRKALEAMPASRPPGTDGRIIVTSVRLESLRQAIRGRAWCEVEFEYDRVLRAFQKLSR
jgi:hypothetical protein